MLVMVASCCWRTHDHVPDDPSISCGRPGSAYPKQQTLLHPGIGLGRCRPAGHPSCPQPSSNRCSWRTGEAARRARLGSRGQTGRLPRAGALGRRPGHRLYAPRERLDAPVSADRRRPGQALPAKRAIIDAEAVVLGENGVADFDELRREVDGRSTRPRLHAFDLLVIHPACPVISRRLPLFPALDPQRLRHSQHRVLQRASRYLRNFLPTWRNTLAYRQTGSPQSERAAARKRCRGLFAEAASRAHVPYFWSRPVH